MYKKHTQMYKKHTQMYKKHTNVQETHTNEMHNEIQRNLKSTHVYIFVTDFFFPHLLAIRKHYTIASYELMCWHGRRWSR